MNFFEIIANWWSPPPPPSKKPRQVDSVLSGKLKPQQEIQNNELPDIQDQTQPAADNPAE